MNFLNIFKKPKNFKSLREYKKYYRLTNKQLAEKFHISESLISHYFTGRRDFGKKVILLISKETGIPLENLVK